MSLRRSMFRSQENNACEEELSEFLLAEKGAPISVVEHGQRASSRSSYRGRPELPWMISTCILAILLPVVAFYRFPTQSVPQTEQDLASTELPALQQTIEYEYQRYTGKLDFNETSRQMMRLHDAEIEYFGPPTDELDDKWHVMLHNEFPVLEDSEVPMGISDGNRLPDGRFHFEPDFFHNLHCVNEIRKQVSRVLYPDIPFSQKQQKIWDDTISSLGPEWNIIHIEHCMDRIRQSLMCSADLTPSVMHRWGDYFLAVGQTGPRKCRKWEPIREWMDQRHAAYSEDSKT